jgi:hypothetical protein
MLGTAQCRRIPARWAPLTAHSFALVCSVDKEPVWATVQTSPPEFTYAAIEYGSNIRTCNECKTKGHEFRAS